MTWTGASATGSFAPSMPFALQINSARKSSGDQCSHRLGLRLIKESTFRERTLGLWGWLVIRSEVKWPSCLLPGDKQAVEDVTGLEGISLHPASPALSFKSFVHLALNTRSNNVAGGGPRSRSRAVHARRAWGEGGVAWKLEKKKIQLCHVDFRAAHQAGIIASRMEHVLWEWVVGVERAGG